MFRQVAVRTHIERFVKCFEWNQTRRPNDVIHSECISVGVRLNAKLGKKNDLIRFRTFPFRVFSNYTKDMHFHFVGNFVAVVA